MNKRELHPNLQTTCVPIPGRSGCFAVVPPLYPRELRIPSCYGLLASASNELNHLATLLKAQGEYANVVLHMLNRREAVDSSQIEGTRTGFDGLLLHELAVEAQSTVCADPDAQETFAYLHAFMLGTQTIATQGQAGLSVELLCAMHKVLLAAQDQRTPGKIRDIQNYIGLRLETAVYIPPPAAVLPSLLADFDELLHYEADGVMEMSILLRAAIAHAQFEAIHPFLDGNGRVGRLLLPLMFQAEGLAPIHLATFLKVRQREYYAGLLAVQTKLNWEPWLRLFLECVIASCKHTQQLFLHLQNLRADWQTQLHQAKKRKHAAVWQVLDVLLGQPVVNAKEIMAKTGVTFPAANQAITDLVALDILRPASAQERHRVFHAHQVMNALYTGLDTVLEQASSLGQIR